jgi:uncharacterized membrane protein
MLSADGYMLVFRAIHILGGIAWGGAIFLLVFFLQPTAKAVGPAAGPFMREFLGTRRVVTFILWIATATIVAGGFLYWRDWHDRGSFGTFVTEPFGGWLTVGAVSALVAFSIGMFATKPTIDRTLALGARIAQGGDPPPPELVQEMGALQARARTLAKFNFAFVAISAFAMSTARYW